MHPMRRVEPRRGESLPPPPGQAAAVARAVPDGADPAGRGERALWRRWQESADPAVRRAIVARYQPFAKAIASAVFGRRGRSGVEYDDCLQFALVGLLEAVDRYDPDRGAQFKTYAGPRIRGAILSGLARMTERQDMQSRRRQLERERISSALPALGALEGGELLRQLGDIGVNVAVTFILDGLGLGEDVGASQPDPYRQLELRDIRKQVGEMVARLPPRERRVLDLHYHQGHTFEEIAAVLEVSRPRVSQLHRRAIERLRELVSKAEGCDTTL